MKKNTKKRKLKVPAAAYGLSTPQQNPYVGKDFASQFGPMSQSASNARLAKFQAGMAVGDPTAAINFNNDLKSAAAESGMNDIGGIGRIGEEQSTAGSGLSTAAGVLSQVPAALDVLTNPFQTSTATTGKEAAMQSIADVGKGMATGAQIGMTVGGPIGAAIGAGAGTLVGAIGKKGRKAGMSSFVDFDEGTLGTGLIGAFSNKKLRRRRAAIRLNAFSNREGVAGTERLANDFNENNMEVDTNTYAYGGSSNSSLAYVDDGEVMKTPDGQIVRVPERGKPTDSNLVNLPDGTRILSNTLKVPGTNKTFAEMGDKMITKRKSKGNDIYAQNAAKLNEMNNSMVHDKLFAMQEMVKAKKGIKPKSKELIPAASGGGETGDSKPTKLNTYPYDRNFNAFDRLYNGKYGTFVRLMQANPDKYKSWRDRINKGEFGSIGGNVLSFDDIFRLAFDYKRGPVHNALISAANQWYDEIKSAPLEDDYVENPYADWTPPKMDKVADPMAAKAKTIDPLMSTAEVTADLNRQKEWEDAAKKKPFDWAQLAGDITALAPIMSNLFTNKPESVPAIYNPYATAITNTMGRRRYNIDPLLRDIEANRNVANYNASQYRTNTGHDMAFRLQSAIAANKANAAARAAESNANNQYKGEYANMMNNLGQQWVNATNLNLDLNAQNRAAARNINRTGLSQLSQFAQNKILMRNQDRRDKAMLELYKPFLQSGFTSDAITNWNRYLS